MRLLAFLGICWTLAGCSPAPKGLALVFSHSPVPHEAALREAGWEVRRMPLPCEGDLKCWAEHPEYVDKYVEDVRFSLQGEQGVLLLGVSRGGYLAARLADAPAVTQVALVSPVTDLAQLTEYRGHATLPVPVTRKRTFLHIGNADQRVSTQAALVWAQRAMGPNLTLVVGETPGHSCPSPEAMMRWLKSQ